MNLNRTLTASVYVVYKDKVLLHMHKKHKTLFPLGGHMDANEVPHETALREVKEESGLQVELYNNDSSFDLGKVEQLHKPMYILLENIGHEKENIDFIYYAKAENNQLNPQKGESEEFYWLSEHDIKENEGIKPHVKAMALDTLKTIK